MLIRIPKIIRNPNQPRKNFNSDSLVGLAQSIKETGLIQPIVVEDNGDGTYTLVGGERRWYAHQILKLETIKANIRPRSNHNGRELLVMGIVENVQREEMNAMDEAEAYQRLHDEYGMDWPEVSARVGKSVPALQLRTILNQLDNEVKELIRQEKWTPMANVTRALINVPDKKARLEIVKQATTRRMTWRQIITVCQHTTRSLEEKAKTTDQKSSPAMRQAHKKTKRDDFDEDLEPTGWNALRQAGVVPSWHVITARTGKTCKSCSLSSMASDATCNECPLVEFIVGVVQDAS